MFMEKISWKNYVRFWKWNLKRTPQFKVFKFKVLSYIQHDFFLQRPGLNKDEISMFKSLVINVASRVQKVHVFIKG